MLNEALQSFYVEMNSSESSFSFIVLSKKITVSIGSNESISCYDNLLTSLIQRDTILGHMSTFNGIENKISLVEKLIELIQ